MQTAAPLACIGQKAVTEVAAAITATAAKLNNGVTVKALAGNGAVVYVGLSGVAANTGFQLSAGQEHFFRVINPATLFVIGTTGSTVCFEGS